MGAGNAAQVMAALISHNGTRVHMYVPYKDECERLLAILGPKGMISVTCPDGGKVAGRPELVSKDAATAVTGSQLVLLPLPAPICPMMLAEICPFLDDGACVGALPGQGGFQWSADQILRDCGRSQGRPNWRNRGIKIFGLEKLPYNCRLLDFGRAVEVFAFKSPIKLASLPAGSAREVSTILGATLPRLVAEPIPHFMSITLAPANQCIHPARMWGLFKDVEDESGALASNPLFYETMDDLSADAIQAVSNEIQAVSRRLEVVTGPDAFCAASVKGVLESLREHYTAPAGATDLKSFFKTAPGFQGIYTPMVKSGTLASGTRPWMPDWNSRYFTEDIPALCIVKALAQLLSMEDCSMPQHHIACAEVKTPTIDMLIKWGQLKMDKQFLVGSTLSGKDVTKGTCIPQNYGATSIDKMKELGML